MGSGGLIRDDNGDWIVGFSSFDGVGDVLLAELTVIKHGLQLAWDEGFRSVVCESDSRDAISILSESSSHNTHLFASTIFDVMELLRRCWSV